MKLTDEERMILEQAVTVLMDVLARDSRSHEPPPPVPSPNSGGGPGEEK